MIDDFKDIFRDPRWRTYYPSATKPHRVCVREYDEGKWAALIVRRTRPESDWPLGQNALNYIADAERDKRIAKGYILLIDHKWNAVAVERVGEVVKRIDNATPTTGPWSEFYWIDAAFKPTNRGAGNNNEIPF